MTLTKQQDALATKLRNAGVPGAFAVLVASRATFPRGLGSKANRVAVDSAFWWGRSPEGIDYWETVSDAWIAEFDHMETTGVRYDD